MSWSLVSCGGQDANGPDIGAFFQGNSDAVRLERFVESERIIAECMADRGYTYIPRSADDVFDLAIDVRIVDPTYYARNVADLESFGLALRAQQVEEFREFPQSDQDGTSLTPEQVEESVALLGATDRVGCQQVARDEAGSWDLETIGEEFGATYASETAALMNAPEFVALNDKFVTCAALTPYPFASILAPKNRMVGFQFDLLSRSMPGLSSGSLTVEQIVRESDQLDRAAFEVYSDCLGQAGPVSSGVWGGFDV